jgi:transcription termination/antitermination protein NusA
MHVEMSALAALTTEKDISLDDLIYAIEIAVLGAYNQTDTAKRHARAHLDRETGEIQILQMDFQE